VDTADTLPCPLAATTGKFCEDDTVADFLRLQAATVQRAPPNCSLNHQSAGRPCLHTEPQIEISRSAWLGQI